MKRFVVVVVLAIAIIFVCLSAASLDGTSSTQYKSTVQVFRRGMDDYVRGFARLGNGFAIASRASGFMDTNISVSGQMDLGETGTLVLLNNLYFDRSITLTSGGNIKGKPTVSGDAKTIFLGGDMTLSSTNGTRVLHITGDWSNSGTSGDLIIDGRGHTLDIQDRAQIFVDTNVTLTLRNMTIRTGPKSLMTPPIRLASNGSKLTLDNVMFDLGADFQFKQGQIFVHDEVAMTGTSAFIYQSPVSSYVTSGATWSFEYGTTFSVAPVTFTDCPLTVNNTYTTNNFIVLADSSSALYLNSCTFNTTYTGLRLRSGMVLFDNRVSVNTMADARLTMTGSLPVSLSYGVYHNSVSWSADGRYIASVLYNPIAGHNNLEVYQFNGTAATLVSSVPWGPAGAANGESMWSKDGRYIAFFGTSATDGNNLRIFYFNGRSLVQRAIYNWNAGASVWGAAFSPDGRFVVACGAASFDGYFIKVFRFDGWSLRFVSGIVPTNVSVAVEADWSPDGRHIAVGQQLSAVPGFHTQIYRFNGTTLSSVTGLQFSTDTNSKTYFLRWSPDGRFVAIAGGCYPTTTLLGQLQVLRFTGKSLVRVASSPVQGYYDEAVAWSSDGNTISVGVSNQNLNKLYRFDGSSLTLLQILTYVGEIRGTEFSPDGRYLAVSGSGGLNIYSMLLGSVTTPQNFANGLVFGDSAKGSGYNANVKVLAGAGVALQGKVTDDSA